MLNALIADAKERIGRGETSVVVIRDSREIYSSKLGQGVSPLLKIIREQPELFRDAVVVDKVIGKAAAMLLVLGGAKEVHALRVSRAGRDYLRAHGIPVYADESIDLVENRMRNGICPFEAAVAALEDPAEGFKEICRTMEQLTKK